MIYLSACLTCRHCLSKDSADDSAKITPTPDTHVHVALHAATQCMLPRRRSGSGRSRTRQTMATEFPGNRDFALLLRVAPKKRAPSSGANPPSTILDHDHTIKRPKSLDPTTFAPRASVDLEKVVHVGTGGRRSYATSHWPSSNARRSSFGRTRRVSSNEARRPKIAVVPIRIMEQLTTVAVEPGTLLAQASELLTMLCQHGGAGLTEGKTMTTKGPRSGVGRYHPYLSSRNGGGRATPSCTVAHKELAGERVLAGGAFVGQGAVEDICGAIDT